MADPAPRPATVDLQTRVLVLTDIVDSTATFGALGEVAAARLWAEHDAHARDLLGHCGGQEIERGDGFLLLFDSPADAARFAAGYHALLARLSTPLRSRIGIHAGPLRVRANPADHVAQGARMLDLDGQAKATTARIQSLAQPGQTLVSAPAAAALPDAAGPGQSHGYWQLKGLDDPLELFEIGADPTTFAPPPDADKAWRVVRDGDLWRPARDVPHSLPAERDRFVGRAGHLAGAAQALQRSRLVSLLGTGGTGKTRLSVRLGWQRLGEHPGGVWFCDLSAATTPDGIVHATAQGLQLPLGAADPVAQVGDAIAGRGACLVILDNFEQVARHAEGTLGRWLQRAPQARFLVTTREVLGIAGEHTLALPPLPQDEGEALLRERAAQAGSPEFEPDDEAAVPELVRLLDGLPLAIELAASRMRVMGPAALLPRMNERFRVLASRGGRPDRQATLRATLDWSWELLTEPERSALAQLSVFEGGFTLEAAQAVVDLSEFAGSDSDDAAHSDLWVVDVVQALVDKSLVRRVGERRFDMLTSVQEFARQSLESRPSVENDLSRRHRTYFGELDEFRLLEDNGVDLDNLVAGTRSASSAGDGKYAEAIIRRTWSILKLVGPYRLALGLARDVINSRRSGSTVSPGEAEWVLGSVLCQIGQPREALAYLEPLIEVGADGLGARALLALGNAHALLGDTAHARHLLLRSLAASQAHGNVELSIRCEVSLGALEHERADMTAAHSHYNQALTLIEAHRERAGQWRGGVLGNLAMMAHQSGDRVRARDMYNSALSAGGGLGDRRWEGNTRCNLGLLLHEMGERQEAMSELRRAISIGHHLGYAKLIATAECNVGLIEESLGNDRVATQCFQTAMEAFIAQDDARMAGWCGYYLMKALLRTSTWDQAATCEAQMRQLLGQLHDSFTKGLVLCALAEIAWRSGRTVQAHDWLASATALADCESGPNGGELGTAIERMNLIICDPALATAPLGRPASLD